jgi:hypothetical protein
MTSVIRENRGTNSRESDALPAFPEVMAEE